MDKQNVKMEFGQGSDISGVIRSTVGEENIEGRVVNNLSHYPFLHNQHQMQHSHNQQQPHAQHVSSNVNIMTTTQHSTKLPYMTSQQGIKLPYTTTHNTKLPYMTMYQVPHTMLSQPGSEHYSSQHHYQSSSASYLWGSTGSIVTTTSTGSDPHSIITPSCINEQYPHPVNSNSPSLSPSRKNLKQSKETYSSVSISSNNDFRSLIKKTK